MPLDHFIPQVYLRYFYSPSLGERLHAIRKADLGYFTPNAKSVCAVVDGSTNAYLREDRLIEEFLKLVEPNYPKAIETIERGEHTQLSIFTIAGFVAFVSSCSPAAMRIYSKHLKDNLEDAAIVLDSKGEFPEPPEVLGGKSLTEMLNNGEVQLTVDKKYPQAFGIRQVVEKTVHIGNFKWEILINPHENNPFFTSDFPTTFEKTKDIRVFNRVVPLSPTLALRIHPEKSIKRKELDFSFSRFKCRFRKIPRSEVLHINRLIVRCAESIVFYRDQYPWIEPFIRKNSRYRVEPRTYRFPDGNDTLTVFTHDVSEVPSEMAYH